MLGMTKIFLGRGKGVSAKRKDPKAQNQTKKQKSWIGVSLSLESLSPLYFCYCLNIPLACAALAFWPFAGYVDVAYASAYLSSRSFSVLLHTQPYCWDQVFLPMSFPSCSSTPWVEKATE